MYQLTIEQTFDMSVSDLFNAWRDLDTIKRWFAPGDMTVPEATADVREGGSYRIVMQDSDGEQHIVGGRYLEVIENQKLSFSWQWEGSPHTTQVEVHFSALGEQQAKLELIHSEFADQESCDKHDQGWRGCLVNLEKIPA